MSDKFYYSVDSKWELVVPIGFLLGVLLGTYIFLNVSCNAKYPSKKPEYTIITGCTIETEDGRVPVANYRVL
jgi:hypothetical protein